MTLSEQLDQIVTKFKRKRPAYWVVSEFKRRRPAYRRKVFGIGYPKTGTTTLSYCLQRLGYKHSSHDMGLTVEVCQGNVLAALRAAKHYESVEDWPWFLIYKELDVAYPDAKFILTKRKSVDAYIDSLRRHREVQGLYKSDFEEPWWWRTVFGYAPDYWNTELFKDEYVTHNESVINYFKDRPDKLLTVCWEEGDGWSELCSFLGRKIPDEPFPHRNKLKNR